MERTDAELVKEYLEGNELAIRVLVERYSRGIYSFIYRQTGAKEEAEDIAQEAFVKIWKNLKKYNPNQGFKTWAYTIARNTAIDWMRKRKDIHFSRLDDPESKESFEDRIEDTSPLADEIFAEGETKKLLEDALLSIKPEFREVVLLHHEEEMSFEEIGATLKKSGNTVKSQYRRALLKMREFLKNAPK